VTYGGFRPIEFHSTNQKEGTDGVQFAGMMSADEICYSEKPMMGYRG
jgi:hypothetical protein